MVAGKPAILIPMPTISNFNQDQYAATDDVRCITIYVPDDDSYMALLGGLLALAGNPDNYLDPTSAQAEGVAAVWADAYRQSDWEGCVDARSQAQITLWQLLGTVTNGGAFIAGSLTNQGQYVIQSPAANNDQWYIPCWLAKGSYELTFLYYKNSNGGLLQVDIQTSGGTLVQSLSPQLQFYNSTLQVLQKQTWTFTLTADGDYRVYTQVAGKHASSSGYLCPISLIQMRKTS